MRIRNEFYRYVRVPNIFIRYLRMVANRINYSVQHLAALGLNFVKEKGMPEFITNVRLRDIAKRMANDARLWVPASEYLIVEAFAEEHNLPRSLAKALVLIAATYYLLEFVDNSLAEKFKEELM